MIYMKHGDNPSQVYIMSNQVKISSKFCGYPTEEFASSNAINNRALVETWK
jgi:hypothetical protein